MCLKDEQLEQLIASICENPDPTSLERQQAINRLLVQLQQLPGLRKSSHLYYLEALDRTWEWVSRNICGFEPPPHLSIQESLKRWINGHLSWRIKDLYRQETCNLYSLDRPIDNSSNENPTTLLEQLSKTGFGPPSLSGIEGYIEQLRRQEIQKIFHKLERYILEDPQGILRDCKSRKSFNCNCQFLSQKLLFKDPPDRRSDLSRNLGIKYQTLNWHWKKKCLPLLRTIIRSLGYSGDKD